MHADKTLLNNYANLREQKSLCLYFINLCFLHMTVTQLSFVEWHFVHTLCFDGSQVIYNLIYGFKSIYHFEVQTKS